MMKILLMMFLAAWIMETSPCLFVVHLKEEQQESIKTGDIEDEIKFKYQKLEKLKAELEDLKNLKKNKTRRPMMSMGSRLLPRLSKETMKS